MQCLDPVLKAQQLAISRDQTCIVGEGRANDSCIGQAQMMILAQRNHSIEEPGIVMGKVNDRHALEEIGKELRILRGEIGKGTKLNLGDD